MTRTSAKRMAMAIVERWLTRSILSGRRKQVAVYSDPFSNEVGFLLGYKGSNFLEVPGFFRHLRQPT